MITISVAASGQYRYGLPLVESPRYGTAVRLAAWDASGNEVSVPISPDYPRTMLRKNRIFLCDIEAGGPAGARHCLIPVRRQRDAALIRFDTSARAGDRRGFTQKYWGTPERVERVLARPTTGQNRWEDSLYVMYPGDAVLVHSGEIGVQPYLMRWNGDSLDRFKIAAFDDIVVKPWIATAAGCEIEAMVSSAKQRRHKHLCRTLLAATA